MKIKTRLCITFGIILTFFLLATVFYGVYKFQENSLKNHEHLLQTNALLKQKALDEKMLSYFNTLQLTAKEIEITEDNEYDLETVINTIDSLVAQTNPLVSYFALKDGRTFTNKRRDIIPNFNAKDLKREWYIGIFDKGQKWLMTKPYTSSEGDYVMALGVPIHQNNKVTGSLCINLDVPRITKFITELSNNEDFFVTNHDGFVFASKDTDEIGKNLFEIIPDFKQYRDEKNAEFSFNWKENGGKKYKVFTSTLSSLDWTFWQYESFDSIQIDGQDYLIHSLYFLAIFIIISLIIIYLLAGRIAKPLTNTTEILSLLADKGCTSHEPDEKLLQRKDEIGAMEHALNNLIKVLRKKSSVAQQIANGDLQVDVLVLSEEDQLGLAFAQMVKDLNSTLGQVNTAVSQVTSGAKQISDSSQSLSSGATSQASSLEEITSSMTELGGQTTANAENATAANQLASETARAALTGQERMNKLTEAMTQISKNADETQKVIKTIDDIAFQTNLLALNAAVEAARAGIHGKGFAVVAEEVRNLAARSAKAAAETADLIQNSNNQIEEGVTISEQTAEALNAISANVTKTTDTIAEIASASSEQANGLKQINIGLNQIDAVTQQNTANAEETASASEEMSSMATLLQQLILHFKLKEAKPARRSAPAAHSKRRVSQHQQKKALPESTGWATTPDTNNAAMIDPSEQIKLDDNEFGKF